MIVLNSLMAGARYSFRRGQEFNSHLCSLIFLSLVLNDELLNGQIIY